MLEMMPRVGRPVLSPMADHGPAQAQRILLVLHESAAAGLDVQDDAVRPQGQLLAHDRGGDERDAARPWPWRRAGRRASCRPARWPRSGRR